MRLSRIPIGFYCLACAIVSLCLYAAIGYGLYHALRHLLP